MRANYTKTQEHLLALDILVDSKDAKSIKQEDGSFKFKKDPNIDLFCPEGAEALQTKLVQL
jgi:hypothetical protein